ncbi:DUF2752 domain-containing protein [Luteimonas sp. e5]
MSPIGQRRLAMAGGGGMLIAAAAGLAVFRRFDPNLDVNPFFPCSFHALTGLWCPGCGGTRALHALAHGDVARALAYNPLVPVLLVLMLGGLLWLAGWRPGWMHRIATQLGRPWPWLVLIPGFWLARNLPWPPFAWLAPG